MLKDLTHAQENFCRIPRVIVYKGSIRIIRHPFCYFISWSQYQISSAPFHLQLQLHEELFRLFKLRKKATLK